MKAERAQDTASRKGDRTPPPAESDGRDQNRQQADERPEDTLDASEIRAREAAIDAAVEMTFPASDPPSWSP